MSKKLEWDKIEFPRSFTAKKEGEVDITCVIQPYAVALYACITDKNYSSSSPMQIGLGYNNVDKWIKKLKKDLEKGGWEVTVNMQLLKNYLSEEDIKNYICN